MEFLLLLENIRLRWKLLLVTNTLAYYNVLEKALIVQIHGRFETYLSICCDV